jgi:hypothetical protein
MINESKRIILWINALLAKTPDKGATLEEAGAAWRKAVQLAGQYGLSLKELRLDREPGWLHTASDRSKAVVSLQPEPDEEDEDYSSDEYWTEWFRARLATNGGLKEIRKPIRKFKDVQPHLPGELIEWLRVEVRRAYVDTNEVLTAVARKNSHNDYYLRGIVLPDGWPTLPAEYLCRFQPGLDRGRHRTLCVAVERALGHRSTFR